MHLISLIPILIDSSGDAVNLRRNRSERIIVRSNCSEVMATLRTSSMLYPPNSFCAIQTIESTVPRFLPASTWSYYRHIPSILAISTERATHLVPDTCRTLSSMRLCARRLVAVIQSSQAKHVLDIHPVAPRLPRPCFVKRSILPSSMASENLGNQGVSHSPS